MNDMSGVLEPLTDMSQWPKLGSPGELARLVGGTWTSEPQAPIVAIRDRLDLTETGASNFLFAPELFFKLNGTGARANLLNAAEATKMGAVGLIVSKRPCNVDPNFPCLIVENPSSAIGRLAMQQRASSKAAFVAVTGSVGKTTTKNMVHHLASAVAPAHRSIANYNIGTASIEFTLSSLSPEHRFSAAEFNEIRELDQQIEIYQPHVAVITNILWEHMNVLERQGFTGDKAIPRLAYLAAGIVRPMKSGGICVLNADAENFSILAAEIGKTDHVQLRTCGSAAGNHVRILDIDGSATGSNIAIQVEGKTHRYNLRLPGRHMAINSVMAAAAAHYAGVDLEPALQTMPAFQTGSRRGEIMHVPWKGGFVTFRDESVSSSVPSVKSSLAQLEQEIPEGQGRRVAVLGHINGIGRDTPKIMRLLAKEAEASTVVRFFTIGTDIRIFNEGFSDRSRVAPHFQTLRKLEQALLEELMPGDVVVFKGTRRPEHISMRRLVDWLTETTPGVASVDAGVRPRARLVIGGDTYFGERYQEKRERNAEINYLKTFGYDYSGERLAPLFKRADFAVANLECALTQLRKSQLEGRKSSILRGNPHETIQALKNLNIGGVLLGNNHAMDYLGHGLEETLLHLGTAQIKTSGGGKGRMEAQRPILKEFNVDGIPFKVAIVSGYEFNAAHDEMRFYAGDSSLGVNNINMRRLREQISALKSDGYFVIVSPHWGVKYCLKTVEQSNMADSIINCGADLILGHGPYMMNEVSHNNGVWVIYSLGNLIFNSEGEYRGRELQPYSLVAELEFERQGSGISCVLNLYPIVSCNQMTQFQPSFTDDNQFRQVVGMLKGMHYDSTDFMNSIKLREVDGRLCMTMKVF